MSAPTVSIVIPAWNEAAKIGDCVRAALEQTSPAHEIIVVDNRSIDATVEIVQALAAEHPDAPIRLLHQDAAQGLVPTRDLGLNAATGEVLGRIDADTVLDPDWVAQVQRVFAAPDVDAATGPVSYYDMPLRRFGRRADDRLRRAVRAVADEFQFLFGSNMALRASAWRDIREHVCRDEADEFHEDIDLSIHLAQRGHRVVYDSRMCAAMSARRLDDNPRRYYRYVWRWERTYAAHALRDPALRAPMIVFASIYPLLKGLREATVQGERLRDRLEDSRAGQAIAALPRFNRSR